MESKKPLVSITTTKDDEWVIRIQRRGDFRLVARDQGVSSGTIESEGWRTLRYSTVDRDGPGLELPNEGLGVHLTRHFASKKELEAFDPPPTHRQLVRMDGLEVFRCRQCHRSAHPEKNISGPLGFRYLDESKSMVLEMCYRCWNTWLAIYSVPRAHERLRDALEGKDAVAIAEAGRSAQHHVYKGGTHTVVAGAGGVAGHPGSAGGTGGYTVAVSAGGGGGRGDPFSDPKAWENREKDRRAAAHRTAEVNDQLSSWPCLHTEGPHRVEEKHYGEGAISYRVVNNDGVELAVIQPLYKSKGAEETEILHVKRQEAANARLFAAAANLRVGCNHALVALKAVLERQPDARDLADSAIQWIERVKKEVMTGAD